MQLRIATRKSELALWQAKHIARRLEALGHSCELLPMLTEGDKRLDGHLAEIGGKGLFLKQLEEALAAGDADIAVHSLKDVPATMPQGFVLAAVCDRQWRFDALVSDKYESLAALPRGAVVGTASLRRHAQLMHLRPDLCVRGARGNLQTRLRKLADGEFDALVLAEPGLRRLELSQHIRERLEPPHMLPAIGQGALGIECYGEGPATDAARELTDSAVVSEVTAERALALALGADCRLPIAGWARIEADQLRLDGLLGDPESGELIRVSQTATPEQAQELGHRVGDELLTNGGRALLARLSLPA